MIIENKLTYGGNVLRKENCFGKEANSTVKDRGFRGHLTSHYWTWVMARGLNCECFLIFALPGLGPDLSNWAVLIVQSVFKILQQLNILPWAPRLWRSSYEWYYNSLRLNISDLPSSTFYVHNASVDGSLYIKTWSPSTHGYYQCRAINVAGVAMSRVAFLQQAGAILSLLFALIHSEPKNKTLNSCP